MPRPPLYAPVDSDIGDVVIFRHYVPEWLAWERHVGIVEGIFYVSMLGEVEERKMLDIRTTVGTYRVFALSVLDIVDD